MLRDAGRLWTESSREEQRAFIQDVFARINGARPEVTTTLPKPNYLPIFKLAERRDMKFVEVLPP